MARKSDSHHVLPLWCDDLIASCVDMTPACFGAYMRLLCYAWTRGGIPDDEAACSRIAGGLEDGDWEAIRSRLTETEDGRLTHQRLELERVAVEEIREQRSEAGKLGNAVRWGSQRDRKAIANGSQSDRKSIAPNPNPNPYPSHTSSEPLAEENTHTHTACGDDFRKPGWAADDWARFVGVWNQTARAAPWKPLIAPSAWVEYAASPGWQDRAYAALERLPGCEFFQTPLAVTKFFEFVDRILAGEFDTAKQDGRRARQRTGGNL
jgi:uncharacterized protein YdaU (DUF1376 family)